jgi:hypothetical protein
MEFKGFSSEDLLFLSREQQREVNRTMTEIVTSRSTLYIGKRLTALRDILVPFGYFARCLEALKIPLRTAYGYMYGYRNATLALPSGAVQAMMDRGLVVVATQQSRALGIYTDAIAQVPVPAPGSSPALFSEWLDEVLAVKGTRLRGKNANRVPRDPKVALLECYRFFEKVLRRLPPERKVRVVFVKEFTGMLLTQVGMEAVNIKPVKIPEEFVRSKSAAA